MGVPPLSAARRTVAEVADVELLVRRFYQAVLELCPFGDAELARWLELWEETVDELFTGEVAALAKQRARMAGGAIGSLARRHAARPGPSPVRWAG